jgi:L-asparaginase
MQAFHKKLLVLGMGGTIAGRSQAQGDNVGYRAGELPVESLLPRGVNDVECLANVQIETRQIAQMDSKDMDHATWFVLARAVLAACADEAVAGIVITHGTDTLEETAFFSFSTVHPFEARGSDVCHAACHRVVARWASEHGRCVVRGRKPIC